MPDFAQPVRPAAGLSRRHASGTGAPLTVTGASEGRIGLDLGAEARYRFAAGAEIFARYDGEFREDFDAHQGTVGLRISW